MPRTNCGGCVSLINEFMGYEEPCRSCKDYDNYEAPQVCEREAEESHRGLKILDGTPTAVSKYLRELEEAED